MGKKRIIKKTEEEIIKESEKINKSLNKEVSIDSSRKAGKGIIFISSTYNNTIISLADMSGSVLAWRSAGSIGFKGAKKGTAFAASRVAQALALVASKLKIIDVDVFVKGVGGGRDMALRTFANQGISISKIKDVTPVPHNGCRPKKPRRV